MESDKNHAFSYFRWFTLFNGGGTYEKYFTSTELRPLNRWPSNFWRYAQLQLPHRSW